MEKEKACNKSTLTSKLSVDEKEQVVKCAKY